MCSSPSRWLAQRHQQQVIAYLQEENHILKVQLGSRRLRLTDAERRHLAALAHPLGRQRLKAIATLVTPDTLLRWYKQLIARSLMGADSDGRLADPASRRRSSSSLCAWLRKTLPGVIAASRGLWPTLDIR